MVEKNREKDTIRKNCESAAVCQISSSSGNLVGTWDTKTTAAVEGSQTELTLNSDRTCPHSTVKLGKIKN